MSNTSFSAFRNFWNSKFQISLGILVLQIISIGDLMILTELVKPEVSVMPFQIFMVIDGLASILLTILNARFLYFFLSKKKFYGYLFLMILSMVLTALINEIPVQGNYPTAELMLIIFSTLLGYIPPLTAMIFILVDSLRTKDDKIYRLVGAANLFILFPIIFGGLLFSLELIQPMGSELKFTSMLDAIYFYTKLSFYGATGFEAPLENISILLKNALTVESFFMDLFALLMLGRLVEK